jgi:phosphoribosylanthranilate isomerase
MSVLLKICGITSLADARYCAGAMVDMLGFVFHPVSPRNVEATTVREIAGWIHGPEIVGVFVDRSADEISTTVEDASLTMVQLHGDESPEDCAAVAVPVIKAFRVRSGESAESLRDRIKPYRDVVQYVLLDAHSDSAAGGTGRVIDWDVAAAIARDFPVLLSGGIAPSNIVQAVQTVRPLGIDLSSGVESRPGNKDFDLVADLMDAFESVRNTTTHV